MQTTGTFPELSAGRNKGRSAKPAKTQKRVPVDRDIPSKGFGGFAVGGRLKPAAKNPGTFAGRRTASHRKAYGD